MVGVFWIECLVRRHVLVCVGFMGSQCNDVYIGIYIYASTWDP